MKRLRIYLDTSIVNFLFADDAPYFRRITVEFFAVYAARYELFVSDIVMAEILRDPDTEHRAKLLAVLGTHAVAMLPEERLDEVRLLADAYLEAGVVPEKKAEDALHVAYATVFEMDFLLSWNFKHLANIRREARFLAVNETLGYRYPLRLLSPLEVENDDA